MTEKPITIAEAAAFFGRPDSTFRTKVKKGYFHDECFQIWPGGEKLIWLSKLAKHHPGMFKPEQLKYVASVASVAPVAKNGTQEQ